MSVLRPIYDWGLKQAEKPYVAWLIFLFAIIEPCLLPTPPDVLLLPAIIARRDKAYKLASICALGSIIGCLIGYGIGALAMATLGDWLINEYHLQSALESFRTTFNEWGTLVIMAKASVPFIPVPFFLVTILSGAMGFSPIKFILAAGSVRITRFFVEAYLLKRYGAPIQTFIERRLNWIALGGIAIIIAWFALAHKTI